MDRFPRVRIRPPHPTSFPWPNVNLGKQKAFTFFIISHTILCSEERLCRVFFASFNRKPHLTLLQTKQREALKCRRAFYSDPAYLSSPTGADLCCCGYGGEVSQNERRHLVSSNNRQGKSREEMRAVLFFSHVVPLSPRTPQQRPRVPTSLLNADIKTADE
ncbi:uncharacterized [Tachysurus ichikawai]